MPYGADSIEMDLSPKTIWKLANQLEHRLEFPLKNGTEWILANSSDEETKNVFHSFLKSKFENISNQFYVIFGPNKCELMYSTEFLESYSTILNLDCDIKITDDKFQWLLVYSKSGVAKFGEVLK